MFKKGEFARVIKSKFLEAGTFVEVLEELAESIYLCGTAENENFIVVGKNLRKIDGKEL